MNDNGRCPLRSKRLVSVLGIRSENGSCQVVAQQPDVQERTLTTLHCHSQGQRQEEESAGEGGSMKVRFEQRLKEVRHRARWMAGEKVKLA